MPRYFFDVRDGTEYIDRDGQVLPDLAAARREALTYAGHLIRDLGSNFWDETDWRIDVRDEAGPVLFALTFASVEPDATLEGRVVRPLTARKRVFDRSSGHRI